MAHGIRIELDKVSVQSFYEEVAKVVATAAKKNPCRISLTVDTTQNASSILKKSMHKAIKSAAKETPLEIRSVSIKDINIETAASKLQGKLDAKPLTLTIKEINTASAMNALKSDIEKMLKGLNITGVSAFLGSFNGESGLKDAIKDTQKLEQAQADARKASERTENALKQIADTRKILSRAMDDALKLDNGDQSSAYLSRIKTIMDKLADASGKTGDELASGISAAYADAQQLVAEIKNLPKSTRNLSDSLKAAEKSLLRYTDKVNELGDADLAKDMDAARTAILAAKNALGTADEQTFVDAAIQSVDYLVSRYHELDNAAEQAAKAEAKRVKDAQDAQDKASKTREDSLKDLRKQTNEVLKGARNSGDSSLVTMAEDAAQAIRDALSNPGDTTLYDTAIRKVDDLNDHAAIAAQTVKDLAGVSSKLDKAKALLSGRDVNIAKYDTTYDLTSGQVNAVDRLRGAYQNLESAIQAVDNAANSDKAGLMPDVKNASDEIRKLLAETKSLDSALKKLSDAPEDLWTGLSKINNADTFSRLQKQIVAFINAWQGLANVKPEDQLKSAQGLLRAFDAIKTNIRDLGTLDKFGASADGAKTALSQLDQHDARVDALKKSYEALHAKINAAYAKSGAARDQATAEINQENIKLQQQVALMEEIQRLTGAINAIKTNDPRAYAAYQGTFDNALGSLGSMDPLQMDPSDLDALKGKIDPLVNSLNKAKDTAKGFWEELSGSLNQFSGFQIVENIIDGAINAVREMFNAVRELDAAMTELRKVTDLTEVEYSNFYKTATQMSGQVGATISDTIQATAEFARLGYNVSEATSLAEAAIIYKNVGDGITSVTQASESMISTMKAFGIEVKDASSLVDSFNEVGKLLPKPVVTRCLAECYIGQSWFGTCA